MDYNIENKILLSEESEYKNLYSWSLQEFNKEGEKIGRDQIPWCWSLYFTASELRLCYSFGINKYNNDEDKESTQDSELITAILHPGICRDGESLEKDVIYSMFGTTRIIKEFRLCIQKLKNNHENEICNLYGSVSNTFECDFEDITTDDCIDVTLFLKSKRFNKIMELVKTQRVDIFELRLDSVSGFYSEWSPSISTRNIKVLTAEDEQLVVKKDGCKINPLRLGDVSQFNLDIIQRYKLNLKQDLRIMDVDKFDDLDVASEDLPKEEGNKNTQDEKDLLLSQFARKETSINKICIPLWLIFIVLCIYVFF